MILTIILSIPPLIIQAKDMKDRTLTLAEVLVLIFILI